MVANAFDGLRDEEDLYFSNISDSFNSLDEAQYDREYWLEQ